MATSSPRRSRDDGYSTVEAVITLPVLILLTMLVVQFALVWHGRHVAQAAAQDGARAARAYQAAPDAGQEAASGYLRRVAPNLLQQVRVVTTRTATEVTVRVEARVLAVIAFTGFSVAETATAPTERFVTPAGG